MRLLIGLLCVVGLLMAGSGIADARGGGHYGYQGGHYAGGSGSSHKGGHYRNSRTGDHYTHHRY